MYFDVVAVVDPVTREAQKLAPLLLVCFSSIIVQTDGFAAYFSCVFWCVVSPPAGFEEAGRCQPAGFHELPVQAVRNAPEEVQLFCTQVVPAEMGFVLEPPGAVLEKFSFESPSPPEWQWGCEGVCLCAVGGTHSCHSFKRVHSC